MKHIKIIQEKDFLSIDTEVNQMIEQKYHIDSAFFDRERWLIIMKPGQRHGKIIAVKADFYLKMETKLNQLADNNQPLVKCFYNRNRWLAFIQQEPSIKKKEEYVIDANVYQPSLSGRLESLELIGYRLKEVWHHLDRFTILGVREQQPSEKLNLLRQKDDSVASNNQRLSVRSEDVPSSQAVQANPQTTQNSDSVAGQGNPQTTQNSDSVAGQGNPQNG